MVYLFYGENSFAAREQVRKLINRFKQKVGEDFGLERFSHEADPNQVISAMTTQSMFAPSALVIIDHPSQNKALCEAILTNLDRVPESIAVVLYDPAIDKRTKWFKELHSRAKVTEFKAKSEPQLLAWISTYAREQGSEIDNQLARVLLERVGADQWRLKQEIEKLVHATPLTVEKIEELVLPSPRHTVFELLDALLNGKQADALAHYDDLKMQNVHELEILSMLGWQVRNLLIISQSAGRSDSEVAKTHGINPYVLRKSKQTAGRYTVAGLASAYEQIIAADLEIKTGGESETILERLLLTIGQLAQTKA